MVDGVHHLYGGRAVKRLVLAVAFLTLGVPTYGASLQIVRREAASSCTNTNITFWWRIEEEDFSAENGTDDYSAGDDIASLVGATVDTTSVKMGTNGLTVGPSAAEHASFTITTEDIWSDADGRIGFWFKYTTQTWPGSSRRMLRVEGGGSTNRLNMVTGTTEGTVTVEWLSGGSTQGTFTTGVVLTVNTWHYIELAWDSGIGSGSDRLEMFVDNTSVGGGSTYTLSEFGSSPSTLWLGNNSSSSFWAANVYYDQLLIADDDTKDLYACKDTTAYP
jgi:hypothetical protein